MHREHVDISLLLTWYEPYSPSILFTDEAVRTDNAIHNYVSLQKGYQK